MSRVHVAFNMNSMIPVSKLMELLLCVPVHLYMNNILNIIDIPVKCNVHPEFTRPPNKSQVCDRVPIQRWSLWK